MNRRHSIVMWGITLLGCLWLSLFPLLSGGTYTRITHDKWIIAMWIGGFSTVIGFVCLILLGRSLVHEPLRLLGFAYFLWLVITTLFGSCADFVNSAEDPIVWVGAGRYEGMATQLCYLAVFLALSIYPSRLRWVLYTAAVSLLVYGGVVAVQYTDTNPFGLFPSGRSILLNYIFQGPIGNIEMVSGYILLVAPILLASWLFTRYRHSWLLLVAGLIGVLLELLMEIQGAMVALAFMTLLLLYVLSVRPDTRSRGFILLGGLLVCVSIRRLLGLPWLDGVESLCLRLSLPCALSALAGLGLMLCAIPVSHHPGRGIKARTALCLLLGVCILSVVLVALLPFPDTADGLYEIHEVLAGRPQDAYGNWRIGVWRHSLHLFLESPILGGGPDTFFSRLGPHLTAEGAYLGENFDNPHNLYLALLVNNGVPGLILYILLLGCTIWQCLHRNNENRVLAAGLIAYSIQVFFTFSICIVSPMFWAILGMAAAPQSQKT